MDEAFLNLIEQFVVLSLGQLDPWKQILDKGREKGQVRGQELWGVRVSHCADEDDALREVRLGPLKISCHD